MKGFVDAYNEYQTTLASLTDYQSVGGALSGDSTARRVQQALRTTTTGVLGISGNAFTSIGYWDHLRSIWEVVVEQH